jgi:hypothetical protein
MAKELVEQEREKAVGLNTFVVQGLAPRNQKFGGWRC